MSTTITRRIGWKSPTVQKEQILKHLQWHEMKRKRFNLPQNGCEACDLARKLLEGEKDGTPSP